MNVEIGYVRRDVERIDGKLDRLLIHVGASQASDELELTTPKGSIKGPAWAAALVALAVTACFLAWQGPTIIRALGK
jgi:hypothetical protein